MLNVLTRSCSLLDERNLTLGSYVLSKREVRENNVWREIVPVLCCQVREYSWRNVIILAYSLSRVDEGGDELWKIFEDIILSRLSK